MITLEELQEYIKKYLDERDSFSRTESIMISKLAKYLSTIGISQVCPVISTWICDESPIGWCIYDEIDDSAHDYCLFCHKPEERK